jgi:phosphohistidine phosphatase SixA
VKRLILLRHAKAAAKEAAEDFDRVLAPLGRQELAHVLAGSGEGLDRLLRGLPTAALAVIDFDVDAWSKIAPGQGHLADFVTPATAR